MPKPLVGLLVLTLLFGAVGGFLTLDPPWISAADETTMRSVFIFLLGFSLLGLIVTRPND